MAALLALDVILHQPKLKVFHNGDQFNRKYGNYFYRDAEGFMRGPFMSRLSASLDMASVTGSAIQMRTPFELDGYWWWHKDSLHGPEPMGPYLTKLETESAIRKHAQHLKDLSGHDQYK